MEKILGIIAEYNPFHNGHAYQIKEAKKLSKADFVVALISSNYTQRGELAIYSSYERAKMALKNGISAVFEMPAYFSCSSAESFAFYGIDFFNKIGIDYISFGAESANLQQLNILANILNNEDENFKKIINEELKKGNTYPKAREIAISQTNKDIKLLEILNSPNNILGIEYVKAINKLNSNIETIVIKRTCDNYNSIDLSENNFSSSTAIRRKILSNEYKEIKNFVPQNIYKDILNLNPLSCDDILNNLHYTLEKHRYQKLNLSHYLDINTALSNRILNNYQLTNSYEKLISLLKSKDYTYTRISRALSHIVLDIQRNSFEKYISQAASYAKLIAFNQKDKRVLSILKKRSLIPFITKEKDSKNLSLAALSLYKHNNFANNLYNGIFYSKYNKEIKNEYDKMIKE